MYIICVLPRVLVLLTPKILFKWHINTVDRCVEYIELYIYLIFTNKLHDYRWVLHCNMYVHAHDKSMQFLLITSRAAQVETR